MSVTKYNKTKTLGQGRILTPWFRAAFASVFQIAKSLDPDKEGKFEITLLFDENHVDIAPLKQAVYECAKVKFGGKIPRSATFDLPPWCASPFHDGAEKPDYQGYEGMTTFKAASKYQPQVIDKDRVAIGAMDQPGFYSGCYARATISVWAYDHTQRKGVGFNIHNVQKLSDGEAFGGSRVDAEDDFDAADDFDGSAIPQTQSGGGFDDDTPEWMR